jgi:hypothetical protein
MSFYYCGTAETKDSMVNESFQKEVVINHISLTPAEIAAIEGHYQVVLAPGRYWYDRACGAWGIEGGPTLGFVMPGLPVGGPLRPDASGGATQVFINGRQLHYSDVMALQRLGPVMPGRYWVDAYWNCGYEGGPALFNLAQLMRARSGGQGGAWSYTTSGFTDNTTVGGDGQGFMYVAGKDHHGDSYTYFP